MFKSIRETGIGLLLVMLIAFIISKVVSLLHWINQKLHDRYMEDRLNHRVYGWYT